MELLIVVAIIAVLVAIAIPVFGGQIKKAKAATCAANCRSLRSELSIVYIDGDDAAVEKKYNEVKGIYTCPEGGKISYHLGEDNVVTVTCSVHNSISENISNALKDNSIDLTYGKRFDSTDPSQAAKTEALKEKVVETLEGAGVKLSGTDGVGFSSWAIVKTKETVDKKIGSGAGTLLLWSDVDIKDFSGTVATPTMCYNVDTGRYTVGLSNVTQQSGYSYLGQSCDVNGFGTDKTNNSKNFATFEEAQQYYKELKN